MVRYMAEKQIKHFKELQAFERLGYRFSPQRSDETTYVFLKHNQTDDVWTIGICSPEHQRYRAECNSFQRGPSSWTGEIPVPNHPKTSPKGQKKVSKARKEKRKEKRHSDPKGSFFIGNTGKTTPRVVGRTLKISVERGKLWRKRNIIGSNWRRHFLKMAPFYIWNLKPTGKSTAISIKIMFEIPAYQRQTDSSCGRNAHSSWRGFSCKTDRLWHRHSSGCNAAVSIHWNRADFSNRRNLSAAGAGDGGQWNG